LPTNQQKIITTFWAKIKKILLGDYSGNSSRPIQGTKTAAIATAVLTTPLTFWQHWQHGCCASPADVSRTHHTQYSSDVDTITLAKRF